MGHGNFNFIKMAPACYTAPQAWITGLEIDPSIIWFMKCYFEAQQLHLSRPVGVTFPPRVPREGNARRRSPVRFFNAQSAACECYSIFIYIASLARPLGRRPVGSLSLVLVTVSRFSEDKLTGPHLGRRHNHRADGAPARTILILYMLLRM